MANNRPTICNNTPTLVIVATPSHLPISNSFRVHGKPSSASRVPRSLSPAVISIDGWIALEKVQIAKTKGMNNDNINPACSPSVATSDLLTSPSHLSGSRVESTSSPPSEILCEVMFASNWARTSIILALASLDDSDVDR